MKPLDDGESVNHQYSKTNGGSFSAFFCRTIVFSPSEREKL